MSKADEYIERLKRRLVHLEERIAGSTTDLAYDKAEASALRWAISKLQEIT